MEWRDSLIAPIYRGVRHPGLWGLQRDKADIL